MKKKSVQSINPCNSVIQTSYDILKAHGGVPKIMKANHLFFILIACIGFSCTTNQENKANYPATFAPLHVTVITDLPDSLQPKTIYLDKMPKPLAVVVPNKTGGSYSVTNPSGEVIKINLEPPVIKPHAVLQNEKGEPILDAQGIPFVMGAGGKSTFTTFTTDDGLALDGIISSVMDKSGNLWFGTWGGGVSRYDGKTFTNLTTAQGLANNAVSSIIADNTGNLWFGTEGGVSRYDGKTFTNLTTAQGLANMDVNSILEDKSGSLWFGTEGGVSRYELPVDDGVGTFTTFTTAQGLANNRVFSILEDNTGNLWFGTEGGGVSRYTPLVGGQAGTFTTFTTAEGLANNRVFSILEDKSGSLWFGTGEGVSRYEPQVGSEVGKFTNFSTEQGLPNNMVNSIIEDKSGSLWFGTEEGVSRYEPQVGSEVGKFTNFSTEQGLPNNMVNSIIEDKSGNLWFGTFGGGISRYDGAAFTNFSTEQGLANNAVFSILEDNTGNLWFGTFGGGVSQYESPVGSQMGSFTNFSTAQGLANNLVFSILEDKSGNLWFGTRGGGVSRYEPPVDSQSGTFTNFTTEQGLPNNEVWSILEDKSGNLWFGTKGGVSRYEPPMGGKAGSFTNFSTEQGLPNNMVRSIIEDNTGNLWFGTLGGGVSRYEQPVGGQAGSFTNFSTEQGLANNEVFSIIEDNTGNLWFATANGLSILSSWAAGKLSEKQVHFMVGEPAISHSKRPIESGAEGTDNLDNKANVDITSTLFKSFKIADGLPYNFVTQVIQLSDGKIAVGTNLGITLFNLSEDGTKLTDIEIYNSNTGYPVKDVNTGQNGIYQDSKGIIWVATGSEKTALVRFDYSALRKNTASSTLVIKTIKVKGEPVCWHNLQTKGERKTEQDSTTALLQEFLAYGKSMTPSENDSILRRFGNIQFDSISKFYPLPHNLVLPYQHNQITFDFVAIETHLPFLVRYQYMLEGYDDHWSPVTNQSNANFGNIKEGTYTFKLKAKGANGEWAEPITYTFKVSPPWYRSWWAYGLYILLFFVIARRIHLLQKARTIRIEREKTKDKELAQAKEIEKAYHELGTAHENLKSTQAQLVQSEKMASLGQLTAGIAHEIQNPLNFVNNFSELNVELIQELKEELENGNVEEVKHIANDLEGNEQKISLHGKRADSIVKGMLEHSRASSGEKELTNLNTLTNEYINLSYQGFKAKNKDVEIELITDFDSSLPKIDISRSDIGKVLLNILNNAFYAVGTGHALSLQSVVTVSTKNLGDKIEISIKDNGPGIPDAIKDKIFQPFFTTKPTGQGTGLGLSLSYDIVKAHGGEIKVESDINGVLPAGESGSTFTIQLEIQ